MLLHEHIKFVKVCTPETFWRFHYEKELILIIMIRQKNAIKPSFEFWNQKEVSLIQIIVAFSSQLIYVSCTCIPMPFIVVSRTIGAFFYWERVKSWHDIFTYTCICCFDWERLSSHKLVLPSLQVTPIMSDGSHSMSLSICLSYPLGVLYRNYSSSSSF